jgi:SAM-dependent methyltransferase
MTPGTGPTMSDGRQENAAPSPWIVRWADRVPAGGRVLDVACGRGRHARYFAARGHPVDALDRNAGAVAALKDAPGITARCVDIEGEPWPCESGRYAGVVVANYLHRPLFPALIAALAPGGVLIYETFAAGNERYGRPTNPDFLLRPGELLDVVRDRLRVVAYEEGFVSEPRAAVVQRLCAVHSREPAG